MITSHSAGRLHCFQKPITPFRAASYLLAAVAAFSLLPSSLRAQQRAGAPDPAFAPTVRAGGSVTFIATQPDGKQLVAGNFSRLGSVKLPSFIRFNADGSLDTGFIPPAGLRNVGFVTLTADGKIVLVELNDDNYPPVYTLRRLNGDGSADSGFNPASFSGQFVSNEIYPFVLAVQADGKVVVAGEFIFDPATFISTRTIIRFNADGSRDTGFQVPGTLSVTVINSLLPLASGQVLVGGAASDNSSQNPASMNVFRLNADGSLDNSYPLVAQGEAFALTMQPDGKVLYLRTPLNSGSFLGGVPRRLNADGSTDANFTPPQFTAGETFNSLVLQPDGKVIAGGYTSSGVVNSFEVGQSGVERFNADGTRDAAFQAPVILANDAITSLGLQRNGQIVVGGRFTIFGGQTHVSLGRLNADGTVDSGYADDLTDIGTAYAVAGQTAGRALVLGTGLVVNRAAASFVVSLDARGSLNAAFPVAQAPSLYDSNRNFFGLVPNAAVAQQADGKILVESVFNDPYLSFHGLKRFNPDGSRDATFTDATIFNSVYKVLPQPDGKVITAGYIGHLDEQVYPVQRLNADGSNDSTFVLAADPGNNPSSVTTFYALALQSDGRILAGGTLGRVNGQYRAGVIRFNTDGSVDPGFQPGVQTGPAGTGAGTSVLALAAQPDGKVIVGGSFIAIGGVPCNNLARLNTDGSLDNAFDAGGAGADGIVRSVVIQPDGKIILGGEFITVNGVYLPGVARLNADGSVDTQFSPGTGPADTGIVYSVALASDGGVIVGGSFTQFDGQDRDGVARLFGSSHPAFFNGEAALNNGVYYLAFAGGSPFGYYSYLADPHFIYHFDLGYEYVFDAADGQRGVYFYDFKSGGYFFTSPTFPFPYLYDFSLNSVVYYYPDPNNAGRYNTNGVRYFYVFSTGQIISK